jgi:MoxR-like ATPase
MTLPIDLDRQFEAFRSSFDAMAREIGQRIVGQTEAIDAALTSLVVGGHLLLEGLPGTGKTLLVRTLADVLDLSFRRIQCTPDLTPTDVIGTYVIHETPQGRRTFEFQKGPLFANLVLADQVNRTTPKTQSALLEAMEEDSITVSTESFPLPQPYLVVATQNPLEMEGTYPLPEAQMDRFLLMAVLPPPNAAEMDQILERTTAAERVRLRKIADGSRILEMREVVRHVPIAPEARRFAIALVAATRPDSDQAPELVRRFVRHGAGTRGVQAVVLAAKARALVAGRSEATNDDLRAVARPALRHRVVLNFEGAAENVPMDNVIDAVVAGLESRL